MSVQLTVAQLWALVAGGPVAMILTVLVGILVNSAVTKAHVDRIKATLKSEIQRVEGVLTAKLDALTQRVTALEDQFHTPLVRK